MRAVPLLRGRGIFQYAGSRPRLRRGHLVEAPRATSDGDRRQATSRACRIHRFGLPSVIALEDVSTPVPGEGEMLVRIAAAGVGSWDALIRAGRSCRARGGKFRRRRPGLRRDEPAFHRRSCRLRARRCRDDRRHPGRPRGDRGGGHPGRRDDSVTSLVRRGRGGTRPDRPGARSDRECGALHPAARALGRRARDRDSQIEKSRRAVPLRCRPGDRNRHDTLRSVRSCRYAPRVLLTRC